MSELAVAIVVLGALACVLGAILWLDHETGKGFKEIEANIAQRKAEATKGLAQNKIQRIRPRASLRMS